MRVAASIAEFEPLREQLGEELGTGGGRPRVAFVPTMGALHAGHRSLLAMARDLADVVVISIFVNPLQFGPDEDYARYPRPLEDDLQVCREVGVDLAFAPTVADLYPPGRQVSVSAGPLGTVLEGAARPGHFDGVLTVVLKLFHIVRPDLAIFGQKDAQQLACVRRMVTDLNIGVQVVAAPIVREPDGLALSSRNVFLGPAERRAALALSGGRRAAAGRGTAAAARSAAYEVIGPASARPGFVLDYLAVVDPRSFAEVPEDHTGAALLVVAARVGSVRLIDNVELFFATPGHSPLG